MQVIINIIWPIMGVLPGMYSYILSLLITNNKYLWPVQLHCPCITLASSSEAGRNIRGWVATLSPRVSHISYEIVLYLFVTFLPLRSETTNGRLPTVDEDE